MNPDQRTRTTRAEDVERSWHVVDANGLVLGRLASQVASVLRGKTKPTYTPHVDDGDFVIVVNAEKVRLTGRKLEQKTYHRHTGYPGGIRSVTAGRLLETHPERVIENAVGGMLPSGRLGRRMLRKLKVYAGPDHPHAAQQPQPLEIRA
jgi:large subunit ribosomal protein L13